MPKDIPSLKPRELIHLLEAAGCSYYREGKGDHRLYARQVGGQKRVVPIDMGARELSPVYVLRIFRSADVADRWPDPALAQRALSRLQRGGWLKRIERGLYMLVPLSAGPDRVWTADA